MMNQGPLMSGNQILYAGVLVGLGVLGYLGWKMSSRSAYESAEFTLLESEGDFQLRQYPELWLATTDMGTATSGQDGSFMRLFRYISGDNQQDQKVAMTTPVFMSPEDSSDSRQMGFVVPKQVVTDGIPQPIHERVQLRQREGGRYAVLRFSGRSDRASVREAESRLRRWIENRDWQPAGNPELAGYDAPWIPGPLRRNEVLIRLK
jgi:DNA gyrase inhibitor GyrI